jgi:hypothetical protein
MRCVFFWFHWIIGTVAYCLAVPCIFIGMDLKKSDIPNWCAWVLFVWVIFHIIVEIVLEIHYCCTFTRTNGRKFRLPLRGLFIFWMWYFHGWNLILLDYTEVNNDYDKSTKSLKSTNSSNKKVHAPGYRWKPTLLFIYSIVTAIVVSALTIGVILFDV